jgi:hypothetical protein
MVIISVAENVRRQLDEVEAIESVYGSRFELDNPETLVVLGSWADAGGEGEGGGGGGGGVTSGVAGAGVRATPPCGMGGRPPDEIAYTVWLTDDQAVGCRFQYPLGYPEPDPPTVTVAVGQTSTSSLTKADIIELTSALQEVMAATFDGTECALEVVMGAEAAFESVNAQAMQAAEGPSHDLDDGGTTALVNLTISTDIGRRLIWAHHIKSGTKKKQIVAWASELKLSGYCKPGYPGIILVEGFEHNVLEYFRRLRRLTWKALVVKGEPRFIPADHPLCPSATDVSTSNASTSHQSCFRRESWHPSTSAYT